MNYVIRLLQELSVAEGHRLMVELNTTLARRGPQWTTPQSVAHWSGRVGLDGNGRAMVLVEYWTPLSAW